MHAEAAAPMPPSPPSPQPTEAPSKPRRRLAIGIGLLAALAVFYSLSLYGFHRLTTSSSGPIQPPNLNPSDDTIVLIRLEELNTVEERLTVKVLVIPQEDMVNQRLHVLTTDTAVRMQPPMTWETWSTRPESRPRRSPPRSRRAATTTTGHSTPTPPTPSRPRRSSGPATAAITNPLAWRSPER